MRVVIALTAAFAALTAATPAAASSHMDLIGDYRGFTQSSLDPGLRMAIALMVDRDNGTEFSGHLTLGPMPFAFRGDRLDAAGNRFDGRGTGEAGEVRFVGTLQGLGDEGGVLVLATYRFLPATRGPADEGTADLVRAPHLPPHDVVPVGGTYAGTYASGLGRGPGIVRLQLIQDGTSLSGQLFLVEQLTGDTRSWDVVGGINPCVHDLVLIGAGDAGRLLLGGPVAAGAATPTTLSASFLLDFLAGGVDLGMLEAGPPPDDN